MKKREDESDDVQGANIYACKSCFLTLLVIPFDVDNSLKNIFESNKNIIRNCCVDK